MGGGVQIVEEKLPGLGELPRLLFQVTYQAAAGGPQPANLLPPLGAVHGLFRLGQHSQVFAGFPQYRLVFLLVHAVGHAQGLLLGLGGQQQIDAPVEPDGQGQRHQGMPPQRQEQQQKQPRRGDGRKKHPFPFPHQLYPFTLRKAPTRSSRPSKTLALVSSARSSSWLSSASPNMMENTGTWAPSSS